MKTAISSPQEAPVFVPPTVPQLLEVLEQKDHIIREQQLLLKLLEEKLRLSRLQRFGANSEKLSFQCDFFDEAELEVALSNLEAQLPIWEEEWEHPETYSNPRLLRNIEREDIRL